MSETKTHKEFWIADIDRYSCMSCGSFICGDNPKDSGGYEGNTLHVIEYSALLEEKQRVVDLIKTLKAAAEYLKSQGYSEEKSADREPEDWMLSDFNKLIKKYGDV